MEYDRADAFVRQGRAQICDDGLLERDVAHQTGVRSGAFDDRAVHLHDADALVLSSNQRRQVAQADVRACAHQGWRFVRTVQRFDVGEQHLVAGHIVDQPGLDGACRNERSLVDQRSGRLGVNAARLGNG